MTRSDEEYSLILQLWEEGQNKSAIARKTGIPRPCVRDIIFRYQNLAGLEFFRLGEFKGKSPETLQILKQQDFQSQGVIFEAYAYVLGIYLGDGYIVKEPRTYKLRIFQDSRYPNIIACIQNNIEVLVPFNTIGIVKKPYNCVEIVAYNSFWPEFFPQHGPGKKQDRPIILEDWQQAIVINFPIPLIRGLIQSDGCRASNMVKGKNYPKYEFTNNSADIKRIFCDGCDSLGVHWTFSSRGRDIQIARRADVDFLDQYIGPKT